MKNLIDGIKKFNKEKRTEYIKMYSHLSKGQNPKTLFITCSDSRIVPHIFTSSEPGDLFVARVVGNKINESVIEAADYAINKLNIETIAICGHSECGAMNENNDLSKSNVIEQIENLKNLPLAEGINIIGLWFDIKEALVYQYEYEAKKFVVIE